MIIKRVIKYIIEQIKIILNNTKTLYFNTLQKLGISKNYNDLIYKVKNFKKLVPPPQLKNFHGDLSFVEGGNNHLRYFINLCGLKRNDTVLDVGCGTGRMAVALTKYLTTGIYEGFDIRKQGIEWCQKKITPKYPNFNFRLVDVYHYGYHPNGKLESSNYKFPFKNNSFNFVFLMSVFTHMLPNDMDNYLSEISRVLKKDGKCLITYFLFNEEVLNLMKKGLSHRNFKYEYEQYRTIDKNDHEAAIAYDQRLIRNYYERNRLKIIEPVFKGTWVKRKTKLKSYQDIIIAKKE